jgi:hypothetical protein
MARPSQFTFGCLSYTAYHNSTFWRMAIDALLLLSFAMEIPETHLLS